MQALERGLKERLSLVSAFTDKYFDTAVLMVDIDSLRTTDCNFSENKNKIKNKLIVLQEMEKCGYDSSQIANDILETTVVIILNGLVIKGKELVLAVYELGFKEVPVIDIEILYMEITGINIHDDDKAFALLLNKDYEGVLEKVVDEGIALLNLETEQRIKEKEVFLDENISLIVDEDEERRICGIQKERLFNLFFL